MEPNYLMYRGQIIGLAITALLLVILIVYLKFFLPTKKNGKNLGRKNIFDVKRVTKEPKQS